MKTTASRFLYKTFLHEAEKTGKTICTIENSAYALFFSLFTFHHLTVSEICGNIILLTMMEEMPHDEAGTNRGAEQWAECQSLLPLAEQYIVNRVNELFAVCDEMR